MYNKLKLIYGIPNDLTLENKKIKQKQINKDINNLNNKLYFRRIRKNIFFFKLVVDYFVLNILEIIIKKIY